MADHRLLIGPGARPVRSVRGLRRIRLTHTQWWFVAVLVAYCALTYAVVRGTSLDVLDRKVADLNIGRHSATLRRFANDYVMLGQRGPSTKIAAFWFLWLCWARRSFAPALRLVIALVLLNGSVGVVKLSVGRWGPFVTDRAHDVFAGGDIYPSGHTSNAVVLYGVMASLVVTHQRAARIAAVFVAITVGIVALYLNYHWLTDIVGGWLAGVLVLFVTPWLSDHADALLSRALAPVFARWPKLRLPPPRPRKRARIRVEPLEPAQVVRPRLWATKAV